MKVLKILLSNCTFLRHSPLMAKLLTTNKKLSDVLKIFSLVKHRNAAIFLVTISQIKIPTNYKDKEIDIWDNSDLIIFQSIIGYMSRYMWNCGVFSKPKRFMFLVNQTTNYVIVFASFSDYNKIEVSYFSNLLEMRENYQTYFELL